MKGVNEKKVIEIGKKDIGEPRLSYTAIEDRREEVRKFLEEESTLTSGNKDEYISAFKIYLDMIREVVEEYIEQWKNDFGWVEKYCEIEIKLDNEMTGLVADLIEYRQRLIRLIHRKGV